MNRKLCLTIILFTVLVGLGTVLAEVFVGVKTGDWIEYHVEFTGTPAEGHDVTWARMEIKDVQGKSVSVEITVEYSNGTRETMTITLNLETGQLGDDFIIPANLDIGDTFFDKNVGDITISSVEERTYAGATRTVAHASTSETTYYWDKATGVLVEGNSQFPEYTMNTIVDRTNIWQPQLLGLDPAVFYTLLIGVAVIITVLLALIVRRRK
ncbi:hypothetical protein JW988_03975 [Candidatus Bathyarchaeota archaeon]|nr:hypothetical protein [Candidatus Bathyarchaeota archaeon]